ncbi:hypothetical protein ACFU7D_01410 [Nocardioides sp. NPDC057577]|uniref:hypothetical protein n=1 Tax=Nocardioides sp. NPDC057577 TaxID=3346171 RepID=UPI00366A6203
MSAIAVPSVRRDDLATVLFEAGTSWSQANHVTATVSLSRVMQETGRVALPIAALLDLIVLPARPHGLSQGVEGFPGQNVLSRSPEEYQKARRQWRERAGWCQFRLEFLMGNALQSAVRLGTLPLQEGTILLRNRREFLRTITALAAAGMRPADFTPTSQLPEAAIRGWAQVEAEVPAFTTLRDALWIDPVEVATGRSARGRDVAQFLRDALQAGFGPLENGARRTLVHHGFYFYTPPQWQLFQLLAGLHEVDQIFVVHDDGRSPAFKTWRRFFTENDWQMPPVEYRSARPRPTVCADAYRAALTGQPVDSKALAHQAEVVSYRNAAEFARHWAATRDKGTESPGSLFYGAASKALARLVRRLDRDQASGSVDLSELPVGSFLLGLHRCIHPTVGAHPRLRLSSERLLDIVSSGYLDVPGSGDTRALAALRRCIQFFDGCDTVDQWITRAEALHRLIVDEVAARGARRLDEDDRERIARQLDNQVRMLPWADLSVEEAAFVRDAVQAVVTLLNETVAQESATFDVHLSTLRDRMERGLRDLPAAEAQEVRSKFNSFGDLGDTVVHVDEVIEIVQMVLGRKPDFDTAGHDSEDDDSLVRPLRSLDALGFAASHRPLHLANLSETSFPSRVGGLGWPLRESDVNAVSRDAHEISLGILRTRSQDAGQGDLYLLHLGLDGVPELTEPEATAHPLTLSWIKELDGDLHHASSLVTLITEPAGADERVAEFVGGVSIHPWQGPAQHPALREVLQPPPSPGAPDLDSAVASLDARATAVAHACPRRFALQWLLGDTPAFRSPHHHAMLYGNVLGAMRRNGEAEDQARRLCDDLWRQFTRGERSSSEAKAVIYPGSNTADEWNLTLTSRPAGYQAAFRTAGDHRRKRPPQAPEADLLAPERLQFLPPGADDPEVCRHCPVRDRCLAARRD